MKHPRKSNSPNDIIQNESKSIIYWLLSIFTVFFLFWAPFNKALFNGNTVDFERPIYSSIVWASIALGILSIYFFYNWRAKSIKEMLSLFVWLIPLTYIISLVNEQSQYLSHNLLYINILLAVFFLLGAYLTRSGLGSSLLTFGLIGSGYVIILFGIFHWFGDAAFFMKWFVAQGQKPVYQDAVMTDSNGLRLTSVFQYANSYAAYLIAIILSCSFLATKAKKWASVSLSALILVPAIISFLLTLSRGAIVVIPFVLILIMLFLPMYKQLALLLHLGIAGVASLLVLDKVTAVGQAIQKGTSTESAQGWIFLLAASIASAFLSTIIQLYVTPWLKKLLDKRIKIKYGNIVLPIACIIIGAAGMLLLFSDTPAKKLLPANILTRVENINFAQHSVLERGTFYKDALKVFKDYPVFGAGGGAWAAVYEKYQNNPYTSRQAHNFFLQYLVEVGAVGLIVLLAFMAIIFFYYIRHYIHSPDEERERHFVYFIVTISLLIHSMIDFDLSYVYLSALVFLCLGGMIAPVKPGKANSTSWFHKENVQFWLNKTYPAALVIISVVMFVISIRLLAGNTAYNEAVKLAVQKKPLEQIMEKLDLSLKYATNHPDYTLYKVGLLNQAYAQTKDEKYFDQAVTAIDALRQAEPHNRLALEDKYNFLVQKGKLQEALQLVDQNIPNFVWDINLYDKQLALNFELGNQARMQKNYQAMDTYWDKCFEVYNVVLRNIQHLATLPKEQLQGRPYSLTPNMAFALGQIDFIRGDFASSANILKQGLSNNWDDTMNRNIATWYLAALRKQGKDDQGMYSQLVSKDSTVPDQISGILGANFLTK